MNGSFQHFSVVILRFNFDVLRYIIKNLQRANEFKQLYEDDENNIDNVKDLNQKNQMFNELFGNDLNKMMEKIKNDIKLPYQYTI